MAFLLRSDNDPDFILSMTNETWYAILELAGDYGWNPLGTVQPGRRDELEIALAGYYLGTPSIRLWNNGEEESRMVLFEDALNLADALDEAFLDFEPQRVPASYFLFEPANLNGHSMPGIGVIAAVVDICRSGSFWVERYRRSI